MKIFSMSLMAMLFLGSLAKAQLHSSSSSCEFDTFEALVIHDKMLGRLFRKSCTKYSTDVILKDIEKPFVLKNLREIKGGLAFLNNGATMNLRSLEVVEGDLVIYGNNPGGAWNPTPKVINMPNLRTVGGFLIADNINVKVNMPKLTEMKNREFMEGLLPNKLAEVYIPKSVLKNESVCMTDYEGTTITCTTINEGQSRAFDGFDDLEEEEEEEEATSGSAGTSSGWVWHALIALSLGFASHAKVTARAIPDLPPGL